MNNCRCRGNTGIFIISIIINRTTSPLGFFVGVGGKKSDTNTGATPTGWSANRSGVIGNMGSGIAMNKRRVGIGAVINTESITIGG
jgi:hypothetical protein